MARYSRRLASIRYQLLKNYGGTLTPAQIVRAAQRILTYAARDAEVSGENLKSLLVDAGSAPVDVLGATVSWDGVNPEGDSFSISYSGATVDQDIDNSFAQVVEPPIGDPAPVTIWAAIDSMFAGEFDGVSGHSYSQPERILTVNNVDFTWWIPERWEDDRKFTPLTVTPQALPAWMNEGTGEGGPDYNTNYSMDASMTTYSVFDVANVVPAGTHDVLFDISFVDDQDVTHTETFTIRVSSPGSIALG